MDRARVVGRNSYFVPRSVSMTNATMICSPALGKGTKHSLPDLNGKLKAGIVHYLYK